MGGGRRAANAFVCCNFCVLFFSFLSFFFFLICFGTRCGLPLPGRQCSVCSICICVRVCVCTPLWGAKHNLPTTPAWAAVTHQRVKERERAKHRQLISRMAGKCACTSEMALLVTTLPSGVRSNDVRAAAAAVCLFPQSPPQLRTATNHTHTHTHIRVQTNTHTHRVRNRGRRQEVCGGVFV